MNNDIQRTQEDHELICRLIDHHEQMLEKLNYLTGVASQMVKSHHYIDSDDSFVAGYETAANDLYKHIKELFNFAETLKDY